jgi:hypothetical protein
MNTPLEVEQGDHVLYVGLKDGFTYHAAVARVHRSFLDKEGGTPGWVNLLIFKNEHDEEPYGAIGGATYDPDKKPGTWHWRA